MPNELTDKGYWENSYAGPIGAFNSNAIHDFRSLPLRRIVELIESVGLGGKRVMEIGAGNSEILLSLASRQRHGSFFGLDYTERGCSLLSQRAAKNSLPIQVVKADFFSPPEEHLGKYDVVYSVGVIEHFQRLPEVTSSLAKFMAPGGRMVSIIPNMRGTMGFLTRWMSKSVFDIHVPHTIQSLEQGHTQAGLTIESSGYLCSTNFGVLSSCAVGSRGKTLLYSNLTRISKLLWMIEAKKGDLLHSQSLSPYLFVVAKARTA